MQSRFVAEPVHVARSDRFDARTRQIGFVRCRSRPGQRRIFGSFAMTIENFGQHIALALPGRDESSTVSMVKPSTLLELCERNGKDGLTWGR